MRKNVAETAGIALVGIDYGILAYFLLFNYSSLSKIFCYVSVKISHARLQFYLRQVQYFYSANVRFNGNRKARYANIKIRYCPYFNFVVSVRHKKALPYRLVWMLNVIYVFLKMTDTGEPQQPNNRRKMLRFNILLRFNIFIMEILQFIITSTCITGSSWFYVLFFVFFFMWQEFKLL